MLRLRLPEHCQLCGALGSVRLEQTIKAKSVTLRWCCNLCDKGWLVTAGDSQPERRAETKDRRKTSRADRRHR